MKLNAEFFATPAGNLSLIAGLVLMAGIALVWQHHHAQAIPATKLAKSATPPPAAIQTFTRALTAFKAPAENLPKPAAASGSAASYLTGPDRRLVGAHSASLSNAPVVLPLSLFTSQEKSMPAKPSPIFAPYGRLIPCETVITIESNHLETPVLGLVTEDIWNDGKLVIPKGAEVHGRAALDRSRERIGASGAWVIVWRTDDGLNGTELTVQGLALDKDSDAPGAPGLHDGSAGLRGEVLRTDNWEEIKLFAATFLSTATTALEDTTASTGLIGTTLVPSATARNATLAGTSAILKEYADRLKTAIDRDGVYVRVAAGKPFYLYVTQTLDQGAARRGENLSSARGLAAASSHEK